MGLNQGASHPWRNTLGLLCAVFMTFSAGPGWADDHQDHDLARRALEAGEVLPLPKILDRVAREFSGEVLDVELERDGKMDDPRWVYKVKVLRPDGSFAKLKLNASTGEIIGSKTKAPK